MTVKAVGTKVRFNKSELVQIKDALGKIKPETESFDIVLKTLSNSSIKQMDTILEICKAVNTSFEGFHKGYNAEIDANESVTNLAAPLARIAETLESEHSESLRKIFSVSEMYMGARAEMIFANMATMVKNMQMHTLIIKDGIVNDAYELLRAYRPAGGVGVSGIFAEMGFVDRGFRTKLVKRMTDERTVEAVGKYLESGVSKLVRADYVASALANEAPRSSRAETNDPSDKYFFELVAALADSGVRHSLINYDSSYMKDLLSEVVAEWFNEGTKASVVRHVAKFGRDYTPMSLENTSLMEFLGLERGSG